MAEYIEREAVMQKFADHVKRSNNSDFAPVPTWNQAVQIVEDSPSADVVSGSDFRDCRNELCLRCGEYKTAHLGSCDGCRWRDCG